MLTGDNIQTAKAIALECGILGSEADATEPNLIEGKVFRAYSDKEREDIDPEDIPTVAAELEVESETESFDDEVVEETTEE